jgi:isoquinoline 1-oxidoreductase beta subunit
LWSREEDMAQGKFHPVTQCKMTGAFDADNNLTALHMRLSGQSILFSVRPAALENGKDPAAFQGVSPSGEAAIGYSVPNLLVEHSMRNPARSARLLARRQRQPECDLYGMLHG